MKSARRGSGGGGKEVEGMNAIIITNSSAEEIAALVTAIQKRRGADEVTLAYLAARKDALEKVERRMNRQQRGERDAENEPHRH